MRAARTIVAIALLISHEALCGGMALAAPSEAHEESGRTQRFTGTVRSVGTKTVDLLTGVGHALRVRHIELPPGLRVNVRGVAAMAPVLTPGCIVRVEVRRTRAGMVASSIELLQATTKEGRP